MESEQTIQELRQALANANAQLLLAQQLLSGIDDQAAQGLTTGMTPAAMSAVTNPVSYQGNNQIIEGVFNGQNMVGADGKVYTIPANYASKSKLVEGDILKLTIKPDGTFLYKQIGPAERRRVVGTLVRDPATGDFSVVVGGRAYRVILAAITYYKGKPGDEVVILTPADGESQWAAVENIISTNEPEVSSTPMLESGDAAELPSGDEAELPSGAAAELTS